jgi:hypothetical protein
MRPYDEEVRMTYQDRGNMSGMTGTQSGQFTGTRNWNEFSGRYKSDWENRFRDKPWTEHEGAYRYGWEYGSNPQYKSRDFNTMSQDMERDWPNRHNRWGNAAPSKVERTWNDFKDTVREGFNRARQEFEKTF